MKKGNYLQTPRRKDMASSAAASDENAQLNQALPFKNIFS
jgi:hypothetical protein